MNDASPPAEAGCTRFRDSQIPPWIFGFVFLGFCGGGLFAAVPLAFGLALLAPCVGQLIPGVAGPCSRFLGTAGRRWPERIERTCIFGFAAVVLLVAAVGAHVALTGIHDVSEARTARAEADRTAGQEVNPRESDDVSKPGRPGF